ncbi:MAG: HEAT repeat domain-containing protein [Terriglobia bacterium]
MTIPATPSSEGMQLAEARRRRASLLLIAVAVLFVVVPFLFWRGTWFGRSLTDEELAEYLADEERPRHIQHALVQIGERIVRGDQSASRWYPQVVELAGSAHPEIRITLAWVLGADTRPEEFHRTLRDFLHDPEPMVRRNAALSLVRFGDDGGRAEILAMLRPFAVQSPAAGTLSYQLPAGNPAERGTLIARLETGQGMQDVQSPVPGTVDRWLVSGQARVIAGEEIVQLGPGTEQVWEALRALYLVGRAEDLPEVEWYVRGEVSGMSEEIQRQAALTAAEIRRRVSNRDK